MIKPTLACQFKCTFCSAADYTQKLDHQYDDVLFNSLKLLKADDVIVTGGEPLLVDIGFYEKLLNINDKITVSITTNLWDFYEHPGKWEKLFKNPRFSVGTSFQYGNDRRKPDNEPYRENDFIHVMQLFEQRIGYVPAFISVISQQNEQYALDHIKLAKRLKTRCRLNGVYPSGRSIEYYPRYKMLELYMQIMDTGLEHFEVNCIERQLGNCPFNTNQRCAQYNASIYVDKNGIPYYSFCEDLLFSGKFMTDNILDLSQKTYNDRKEIPAQCFACNAYMICHGCLFHSLIVNSKVNTIYCHKMTSVVQKLKTYGFKT